MVRTTATLLTFVLLLAACGDENGPTAPPGPDAIEIPTWAKVAPEQIAEAKKHGVPVAFENDLGMRFVLIPAGTFLMGSPEDEEGRSGDFETQHEVTISRPFYMSIYEVTNAEYRSKEPGHDSGHPWDTRRGVVDLSHPLGGDTHPVCGVSWLDAVAFAGAPRGPEGERTYRLPTEAEWEYACRAGSKTRYSWAEGESDAYRYANGNDPKTKAEFELEGDAFPCDDGHRVSAPVGSFRSNAWGLYDMHGNVWEWCRDRRGAYPTAPARDPDGPAAGVLHVLRGGDWGESPAVLRSAFRGGCGQSWRGIGCGFRLAAPLPEPGER